MSTFLRRNSSTILIFVGMAGVIGTSIVSVLCSKKADAAIAKAQEEKGEELTTEEKIKAAAPSYIPAALTGAATITSIALSHHISKEQIAALSGLCAATGKAFNDFRKKVREEVGVEKEKEIREKEFKEEDAEIISQFPPASKDLYTFYDLYSKQYFSSNLERVYETLLEMNHRFTEDGSVSLNEYYDMMCLPKDKNGAEPMLSTCLYVLY